MFTHMACILQHQHLSPGQLMTRMQANEIWVVTCPYWNLWLQIVKESISIRCLTSDALLLCPRFQWIYAFHQRSIYRRISFDLASKRINHDRISSAEIPHHHKERVLSLLHHMQWWMLTWFVRHDIHKRVSFVLWRYITYMYDINIGWKYTIRSWLSPHKGWLKNSTKTHTWHL